AFQNFSTFTVSPMINIHDLIVLPAYRGKDIGCLLLKEIINIANDKKCSRITLEVRNDNLVAQNLYKKIGFAEAEPSMYYWRKNLL
ncbi:GNAT family N-acetyltransferase, partial [Dysgonomonas capnocytophagoides]